MNFTDWIEKPFASSSPGLSVPNGVLRLEPIGNTSGRRTWRRGRFISASGNEIQLSIGHSPGSSRFLYLRSTPLTPALAGLLGISPEVARAAGTVRLPGQLLLGSERTIAVVEGVASLLASPEIVSLANASVGSVAVFPVLREGLKYGVTETLFREYGLLASEVVIDCHHVPAPEVEGYGRRAVVSLCKDKDWTREERGAVRTAVVADSVAGGVVLLTVLETLHQRFPCLEQIEVVAPLITMHGLARLAGATGLTPIRIHCFETILNALAPDFYDSAQMPGPEWHVSPELAADYRDWWGQNDEGRWIADTLCAGVGWSESFFTPSEQLRMLEDRLRQHGLSVIKVLSRLGVAVA